MLANTRNNNGNPKRSRKKNRGGRNKCPISPPPYIANVAITRLFRFCPTTTGVYTITAAKLGSLVVMATTSTTAIQFFDAVKVNWIRVWGSAGTQTAVGTVGVSFPGIALGVQGPEHVISDTTVGATYIARVHAVPPRNSQAAQWQATYTNVGTNTLFKINVPNGGVVDINLSLSISHDTRAVNNSVTVAAATVGQIYYLSLDNAAGGTGSVGNVVNVDPNLITL
jgi:hypothetical protein